MSAAAHQLAEEVQIVAKDHEGVRALLEPMAASLAAVEERRKDMETAMAAVVALGQAAFQKGKDKEELKKSPRTSPTKQSPRGAETDDPGTTAAAVDSPASPQVCACVCSCVCLVAMMPSLFGLLTFWSAASVKEGRANGTLVILGTKQGDSMLSGVVLVVQ